MTNNLSETIRDQFGTMRHLYAGAIHEQLRSCRVVDDLRYDGKHSITAWCDAPEGACQVDLHVTAEGVQVTFANPEPAWSTAVIAAPYTISAVVKVVEGLLMATTPCPASTSDTTDCCGELMFESDPHVLRFPDSDRVQVTRVYHCVICGASIRIDVTDPAEAAHVASNWWR